MTRSKGNGKLHFGRYPYTVTRVKVLQSYLLPPDDYLRMKKMGTAEMTRFLEEGQYKREIDALSGQYQGLELIELAFNQNLAATVNKLLQISIAPEIHSLIRTYANKWIVQNCKIAIRARFNQVPIDDVRFAIIPIAPTTYDAIEVLIREPIPNAAAQLASFTGANPQALQKLLAAAGAMGVEQLLDRAFYQRIIATELQMQLKRDDPLREFLRHTVLSVDIKNIIRLKAAGAGEGVIRGFVMMEHNPSARKQRLLQDMMAAASVKECIAILSKSLYRDIVAPEVETNIAALEDYIERFLLSHASPLLHRKPLSISPIFGYLLQKEIELRNLRLILHGRALELPEEFIDRNLLIAR